MSKGDQRYVFNDHVDPNEDEELERLLQRSKRLGTNLDGLRRRPLHPNAEDYEDSDDEANEEIRLIKETCKDELFTKTEPISSTYSVIFVLIIVACVFGLAVAIFEIHRSFYKDQISCEPSLVDKFRRNIIPYKQQFPSQSNELWANLLSGIQLLSTSARLSVFLIIHDATTNTSCLAKALGHVSANLLGNSSQPLIVPAIDLDPESFRQDLSTSTRHAIVVEEIQRITVGQEDKKQLLHGLADTENPIVPGSAVVFTLQVRDDETKSPLQVAELELGRVWNWIDSESRGPLIVRVTSGFVYRMANEKEAISC